MHGALAGLLCVLAWSPLARAHAPLARSVLVANDGSAYVYSSWFGMVLRSSASEPFGYACDAAFGMERTARPPVWALRSDGSIVFGNSQSPPRVVSADGCQWRVPSTWPADIGIAALGRGSAPDELIAVTHEDAPAVLRSLDDGETWQVTAQLEAGVPVTGMQVVPREGQAARVYLTRPSGTASTAVMISDDGGSTFTITLHGADLTLLDVRAGASDELWLLSPRLDSHEVAIVRGAATATVFQEVHRVRFFGGLALSRSDDKVWIADEAGALVRSDDGGETFIAVQTELAVACLVHREGTLWACTSGTPDQPALASSVDDGVSFRTEMNFADVDQLLRCETQSSVAIQCASEWLDWQRDVLPQLDAGDDGGAPRPKPRSSGGCSIHDRHRPPQGGAFLLLAAVVLGRRRRVTPWVPQARRGQKRWWRRAPR